MRNLLTACTGPVVYYNTRGLTACTDPVVYCDTRGLFSRVHTVTIVYQREGEIRGVPAVLNRLQSRSDLKLVTIKWLNVFIKQPIFVTDGFDFMESCNINLLVLCDHYCSINFSLKYLCFFN